MTELPAWATAPVDPLSVVKYEGKPYAGAAPVGINPPEKDLPPAPPVGAVAGEAPEKPKRGRPKKDPDAADQPIPYVPTTPGAPLHVVFTLDPATIAAIAAAIRGAA